MKQAGFQNACAPSSRWARGFSLLEMVVVLTLMAVIMGVTFPILMGDGPSNREMMSAARQLAAGARKARSDAVAQRREAFLYIDLEGRRFKVDQESREYQLPEAITLKLFTAQSDLIDEKTGSIRFYPDGGSNGGRITVAAGANSERLYEVDIDWLTGRVSILE